MNFNKNVKLEEQEKINTDHISTYNELNFMHSSDYNSRCDFISNYENFHQPSQLDQLEFHNNKDHYNNAQAVTKYDNKTMMKSKFKGRLEDMKTYTEKILENIRNNFNKYIDDQKTQLINSLNTIQNIFEVESISSECENEKMKQIEKKMELLSIEINGLIADLHKFTK